MPKRAEGPLWTCTAVGTQSKLVTAPTALDAAKRYVDSLDGYRGFVNVREGSTGRLLMFRSTSPFKKSS